MIRALFALLALLAGAPAYAQGTLPVALQQQFSFTGCTGSLSCGTPLIGGLLYFYQAGTVATPQDSFQDTGLTLKNPWPLPLDGNGRVPMFYLASGSVHVRLTDSAGVVQFDIPSALVIGPSGGGGGGGGVDPTSIASTGDIKFRMTGEIVTGWVKLNGLTIGNATSGATGRANNDTQNLYVYEWTNCTNSHCPVLGGRGATALADFNANKQLTLPDWRSRAPVGQDCMGTSCAGRLLASNVTSGGGDGVDTPGASGGEANHTLLVAELAAHNHVVTLVDPGHTHTVSDPGHVHQYASPNGFAGTVTSGAGIAVPSAILQNTVSNVTGIGIVSSSTGASVQDGAGHANATASSGSSSPHNVIDPFVLGSWYVKL